MTSLEASDLQITLSLRKDTVPSAIKIPGRENSPAKKIFIKLSIKNIRKDVVAIHVPMWFTELHVEANGKKMDYIGPAASLPPPQESDIKKLQHDAAFEEEVELNTYYALPTNSGTEITVKYTHPMSGARAETRFKQ